MDEVVVDTESDGTYDEIVRLPVRARKLEDSCGSRAGVETGQVVVATADVVVAIVVDLAGQGIA